MHFSFLGRHIYLDNDQNLDSSSFDPETSDTPSLSRNRLNTVRKRDKDDNTKPQRSIAVLSKEHIESIERLYDEIVGMFNRSNLPKKEFPSLSYKMNNKIDEKVGNLYVIFHFILGREVGSMKKNIISILLFSSRIRFVTSMKCLILIIYDFCFCFDFQLLIKLQQMSDVIQSCGYRFSTFQVYTKDGFCSEDLNKNVKALLEEHGITEYSIVSSDINTFSTCHVGKKIAVKKTNDRKVCGTLGGFAHTSSGESERTWALISRHVASCSSDGNLYVENGKDRMVAKIMKQIHEGETEKQYLDIAAACLENDAETGYDTRYITEENITVQGKLCNYDTEKLRGLPVHIKGASTPLGLGTVTIPEQSSVQNYDLGENYIVVEDREENGAFCKEGDSGAMVCAEHPDKYGEEVQLISMVVGENCGRKGSYTTVRLDKGLAELKTLTEKEFNLS
ncbi:uncharacterized protein LOC128551886 isoform X1 [Mercenaria mercenaria]|uniref:uncharacterized protein LOC128551886 isoform X1 n=1 Tax=Mercenaria mercenaria TaxID=6596 RepID=UPI00234E83D9|nr:uncharacterized protein LOC128551886 isoform X1 [Mercenaria mercenaria]XP_053388796.1 uncharacterized protein LOC128551886 isoform X1 [Mercenaria mercenaria]XP_053388797.1 uncharacterized protein LOC128551886 isoform X1 [Mercenaria mercenaria]